MNTFITLSLFSKAEAGPTVTGPSSHQLPWLAVSRLVLISTCIMFLQGCADTVDYLATMPFPGQKVERLQKNHFLVEKNEDVVGELAAIRVKKDDTLPDIARHFSLGINTVKAVNPDVDVWGPKAGTRLTLPLRFTLPDAGRKGIVINLAAMRLFHFQKESGQLAVSTYPVGIGTDDRPTPRGRMHITRKKFRPTWYVPASIRADHRRKGDPLPAAVPPGPLNPLGEHALYLNKPAYLIHGTFKPSSIGLRATNGCIRLYPENIKELFDSTDLKTQVRIVYQPYLVGQADNLVYLEAHQPFPEAGSAELEKTFAKLKKIEKKIGHPLDWKRITKVIAEARGIPVAIAATESGGKIPNTTIRRLRHPAELYGEPQVPELRADGWYVLAGVFNDKVDAHRISAILNHQGPQIPARVLSKGSTHRVITGPFKNEAEARTITKRMKIYLDIDGILVPPA